jgi:Ni,Fe-hydrogenase I cytochrome b subunit
MADPHGGNAQAGLVLVATFLFVLVATVISTGLLVYTAWRHDLEDGLFALAFAVLSARAVLSWRLWHHSLQQDHEPRKPADETLH